MITSVYAGTAVTVTMTFSVPSSTDPVDPSTVSLVIQGGSSPPVTWVYSGEGSIVRVSEGVYSAELDTTPGTIGLPGAWTVQAVGTDACAAVDVASWTVQTPPL